VRWKTLQLCGCKYPWGCHCEYR